MSAPPKTDAVQPCVAHAYARDALRLLWSGMLLIVLGSALWLASGLWQSAVDTARQIGQLEANLLAEGEAERLRLNFEGGIAEADPAQVEAMLAALAHERRAIRTLEVVTADKRVIASHIRPGLAMRSPQDPGWHRAVGRIEVEATTLSELHVGIYRQRQTRLSTGSVIAIFTGFALFWALLTWLLLQRFCARFIEEPGKRLQQFRRRGASAALPGKTDGLWTEAWQAERAKLDKLQTLLTTIRRRAADIEHDLPSMTAEVRAVLANIDDLQQIGTEARP